MSISPISSTNLNNLQANYESSKLHHNQHFNELIAAGRLKLESSQFASSLSPSFDLFNLSEAYLLGTFLDRSVSLRSHVRVVNIFPDSIKFNNERFRFAVRRLFSTIEILRLRPSKLGSFSIASNEEIIESDYFHVYSINGNRNSPESESKMKSILDEFDQIHRFDLIFPMISFHLFQFSSLESPIIAIDCSLILWNFQLLTSLTEYYQNGENSKIPKQILSFREYSKLYIEAQETSELAKFEMNYWKNRIKQFPSPFQLCQEMGIKVSNSNGFIRIRRTIEPEVYQSLDSKLNQIGLSFHRTLLAVFCLALQRLTGRKSLVVNCMKQNTIPFVPVTDVIFGSTSASFLTLFETPIESTNIVDFLKLIDISHRLDSLHSSLVTAQQLMSDLKVLHPLSPDSHQSYSSVTFNYMMNSYPGKSSQSPPTSVDFSAVHAPHPCSTLETVGMDLDLTILQYSDYVFLRFDQNGTVLPGWVSEFIFDFMHSKLLSLLNLFQTNQLQTTSVNEWINRIEPFQFKDFNILSENLPEIVEEKSLINQNPLNILNNHSTLMYLPFLKQCINNSSLNSLALLSDSNYSLTYKELFNQIFHLAKLLRIHYKVKPNEIVSIILPKGPNQIIAALAIQYAGGAYNPIDTNFPLERKLKLLNLVKAKCFITFSEEIHFNKNSIQTNEIQPIYLDQILFEFNQNENDKNSIDDNNSLPILNSSSDLAYIIFTSGSTGEPKAVAIQHSAGYNTVFDMNDRFEINSSDCVLSVSALNFDLSVYDIFGFLGCGGRVCIPSADAGSSLNPNAWIELMNKCGVTIWNSAPQLFELLLLTLESTNQSIIESAYYNIKKVFLSGDWISVNVADRFRALSQRVNNSSKSYSCEFISLGGATECSIWSNYHRIQRDFHKNYPGWNSIPYGVGLKNQDLIILDFDLNLVGPGVTGELYIGGLGLAKEYFENQELTSRAFIFHSRLNRRIYKTGDVACWKRWRNEWLVEFLGRNDRQVKIQGYRIELGEIENIILKYHANEISQLVAIAYKPLGSNEKSIGIYFRFNNKNSSVNCDSEQLVEKIMKTIEFNLPIYMKPSFINELENIPITSNGKLDYSKLEEFARNEKSMNSIQEEISGSNEISKNIILSEETINKVVSIWSECLNLPPNSISIHSNWHSLGGSSFRFLRMRAMLEQSFSCSVSLPELMNKLTLREVCEMIQNIKLKSETRVIQRNGNIFHSIRTVENSISIVLLPPSSGVISCYSSIINYLLNEFPFISIYAIQLTGLESDSELADSVESIAEDFNYLIKEKIKESSFILLAWSMGGVFGFEMIQQMKRNSVFSQLNCKSLIMIDTPSPIHYSEFDQMKISEWFQEDSKFSEKSNSENNNFDSSSILSQHEKVFSNSIKICYEYGQRLISSINEFNNSATEINSISILYLYCSQLLWLHNNVHSKVGDSTFGWNSMFDLLKINRKITSEVINANHYSILIQKEAQEFLSKALKTLL